jgi:hypothetical protein
MMPQRGGGRRDPRVTVVTGNLKVLKKYDTTGPAVIDTGTPPKYVFGWR